MELGYETRLRITLATLAGFFAALGFVCAAMGGLRSSGCVYLGLAALLMFGATTNRWLMRTTRS